MGGTCAGTFSPAPAQALSCPGLKCALRYATGSGRCRGAACQPCCSQRHKPVCFSEQTLFESGNLHHPSMKSSQIRELQKKIGYKFKNQKHLVRALTHPTFSEEEKKKKVDPMDCPDNKLIARLGMRFLKQD